MMLKVTAAVTVLAWIDLFLWFAAVLRSGPSVDRALAILGIVLSIVIIVLCVAASLRRSRSAAYGLLAISVLAALWAAVGVWTMVSPGFRFLGQISTVQWVWLVGWVMMCVLPWLWGLVCFQFGKREA